MDDEALAAIDLNVQGAIEGDEQLLREALEALEGAKADVHDVYTYSAGEVHDSGCRLCRTLFATIMKLEERLLRE